MDEPTPDPESSEEDPTNTSAPTDTARDPRFLRHRLGDFEILREIGRGGMGVVYEALQISLNRPVALKVLPPGLGLTAQAVQRFQREAQAAAKLHHTHIVPIYSVGQDQACHYYAMELVDGQTLAEVLGDLSDQQENALFEATVAKTSTPLPPGAQPIATPLAAPGARIAPGSTSLSGSASGSRRRPDTVALLIAEVAEALHYAHGQGVVHRDIKPANLMLARDGKLRVTDFGLAQVAHEPGMTVSGSLLGTPAYMSPEQVAAGRVKIDHRTDVYSLGTVLYEMLTLRRPFSGESREEVLSGILTKEPRPPRRVNPRVPVDLETICLKAIEKDPDQRYATAGLLAEDLRAYLSHGLIAARRASAGRRAAKWVRRHPVATLTTGAAIVVAALVTIAVQQGFGRSHAEAHRLVASAEIDVREGTYREGLEKVSQALEIAPDLFEAKKTRGRLLLEMRRDRELANLATEILQDRPEDWEAHGWLAFAGRYGRLADIPAEEHAKAVERLAPESADAWYVKGLIAATDSDKVRCFDRALDLNPGHAWALLQRGHAHQNLGNYPAAIADGERVIAARPRSPRGRRFLASIYNMGYHDAERALAEFDKAIAIDPEDAFSYFERSWVYAGLLGNREKAVEDQTRAVELAPENAALVARRASDLNGLGRWDEGLAEGRRAAEIEPDLPEGYWPILNSLFILKRTDEWRAAKDALRKRAERWADKRAVADLHHLLGLYQQLMGDNDESIASANRAIELDPENLDAYVLRAETRRREEGVAAVEQECDLIARLDPKEPAPLLRRGTQLLRLCRRPALALADFTNVIAIAPEWPNVYLARSDLLVNEKRWTEALADADRAIELAPTWPSAIFKRVGIHFVLERWKEAVADLDRYFATGAEGADGRWLQAQALAHLGREDEALAAIDTTIRALSNLPIGHLHRSILLFNLGRVEDALAAVDDAVEIQPNYAHLYIHRARVLAFTSRGCARAEGDLQRAVELDRDDADVRLGEAIVRTQDLAGSCPEAVQLGPSFSVARDLVDSDPKRASYQGALGIVQYRAERFDEALEALRQAIELAPEPSPQPEHLLWLAMTEAKLGRGTDARRTYARAVARMNATWPKSPLLVRLNAEAQRIAGL